MPKLTKIAHIRNYCSMPKAEAAVELLAKCGIKAAIEPGKLGRKDVIFNDPKKFPIFVRLKDSECASGILEAAARFATQPDEILMLPPAEGTLENLDMLIHDCRQYLMIATGELKSIEEEGVLALDDPTNDIEKITIRLKRLKDQCMRMAGKHPFNWQR